MPLIILIVVFVIIAKIIDWLSHILSPVFSLFAFAADNFLILFGLACLGAAIYVYSFYKPHPAEKYIKEYQEGKIARSLAVQKVADTMYDISRDELPPAHQSEYWAKRLKALTKRVQAEETFLQEIVDQIKAKAKN